MAGKFEGELYIGDVNPPQLSEFKNLDDENPNSFELLEADKESVVNTVYERAIFKYKDPTSPPHTKKNVENGSNLGVEQKFVWVGQLGIDGYTALELFK